MNRRQNNEKWLLRTVLDYESESTLDTQHRSADDFAIALEHFRHSLETLQTPAGRQPGVNVRRWMLSLKQFYAALREESNPISLDSQYLPAVVSTLLTALKTPSADVTNATPEGANAIPEGISDLLVIAHEVFVKCLDRVNLSQERQGGIPSTLTNSANADLESLLCELSLPGAADQPEEFGVTAGLSKTTALELLQLAGWYAFRSSQLRRHSKALPLSTPPSEPPSDPGGSLKRRRHPQQQSPPKRPLQVPCSRLPDSFERLQELMAVARIPLLLEGEIVGGRLGDSWPLVMSLCLVLLKEDEDEEARKKTMEENEEGEALWSILNLNCEEIADILVDAEQSLATDPSEVTQEWRDLVPWVLVLSRMGDGVTGRICDARDAGNAGTSPAVKKVLERLLRLLKRTTETVLATTVDHFSVPFLVGLIGFTSFLVKSHLVWAQIVAEDPHSPLGALLQLSEASFERPGKFDGAANAAQRLLVHVGCWSSGTRNLLRSRLPMATFGLDKETQEMLREQMRSDTTTTDLPPVMRSLVVTFTHYGPQFAAMEETFFSHLLDVTKKHTEGGDISAQDMEAVEQGQNTGLQLHCHLVMLVMLMGSLIGDDKEFYSQCAATVRSRTPADFPSLACSIINILQFHVKFLQKVSRLDIATFLIFYHILKPLLLWRKEEGQTTSLPDHPPSSTSPPETPPNQPPSSTSPPDHPPSLTCGILDNIDVGIDDLITDFGTDLGINPSVGVAGPDPPSEEPAPEISSFTQKTTEEETSCVEEIPSPSNEERFVRRTANSSRSLFELFGIPLSAPKKRSAQSSLADRNAGQNGGGKTAVGESRRTAKAKKGSTRAVRSRQRLRRMLQSASPVNRTGTLLSPVSMPLPMVRSAPATPERSKRIAEAAETLQSASPVNRTGTPVSPLSMPPPTVRSAAATPERSKRIVETAELTESPFLRRRRRRASDPPPKPNPSGPSPFDFVPSSYTP